MAEDGQFVEVAPLEHDEAINDMEEPAPSEALRISPLEDRPFSVLKQVLDMAMHIGLTEVTKEHRPDGLATLGRFTNHLVVHSLLGIEGSQPIRIADVEGVDPLLHELPWLHVRTVHAGLCAYVPLCAALSSPHSDGNQSDDGYRRRNWIVGKEYRGDSECHHQSSDEHHRQTTVVPTLVHQRIVSRRVLKFKF